MKTYKPTKAEKGNTKMRKTVKIFMIRGVDKKVPDANGKYSFNGEKLTERDLIRELRKHRMWFNTYQGTSDWIKNELENKLKKMAGF